MTKNNQNIQYIDQSLKTSTTINNRNYKNSVTNLTAKITQHFKNCVLMKHSVHRKQRKGTQCLLTICVLLLNKFFDGQIILFIPFYPLRVYHKM